MLESADPAAALLEYARANHVDHVVIGAPPPDVPLRGAAADGATKVALEAPCTVTLVRRAGALATVHWRLRERARRPGRRTLRGRPGAQCAARPRSFTPAPCAGERAAGHGSSRELCLGRMRRLGSWWMSRSFVSGMKMVPSTAVISAITIGYQRP